MSATSRADDARILEAAYREEIHLYRQALVLATSAEGGDAEWPRRLNEIFRGIAAVEARIASLKKRWQADRASDPAVDLAVRDVATLIAQLQQVVGAAMSRVEKQRETLMPEMAAFVRTDRVRQAYRRVERLGERRERRGG
jgi:hypothetical protein